MKYSLYDRLIRRELGDRSQYSRIGGIYGDKKWIKDLDIVNELDGHNGCVNALSWSKNGELLASGSDDTHVNVHSYQPENSTAPFKFRTSIATGHTQNIFATKFMPHSSDRTIISAAGDSQIRIYDLEYAGRSTFSAVTAASSRARGYASSGVQYLSEADTNTRVYRSHSDRVKKIVTESSPFLFLSCSEDGEVRQWDLRLPSTAYPKPRGPRSWRNSTEEDDSGVPPPLITYKRFGLDINSISCSPSQPHYIALGGAHLHCFLHDRRMLGRDRTFEWASSRSPSGGSERDDDAMCEATQCVKRFAPNGQQRMRRTDNGHITACKISDANPNEMVVSWSGEWIYNFDLLRSPDAKDVNKSTTAKSLEESHRSRHSRALKRKRAKEGSALSVHEGIQRAGSKPRTGVNTGEGVAREVSLRVRYENGQSENIRIQDEPVGNTASTQRTELPMSECQRRSYRLANTSVRIRQHMFTPGDPNTRSSRDPTGHATSFTSVLGFCASVLDELDDIMRKWRYTVDPDQFEVAFQKHLRAHRESARRFIQASGVLARVLGGRLHTGGANESRMLDNFAQIVPVANELPIEDPSEQFNYDFLKAIGLWLDSGPGAVVEGFTKPKDRYRGSQRFPIPEGAGIGALDELLIPYLLDLAGTQPIIDITRSRFEIDVNRQIFKSQRAAVIAFARALKIPFEDLSSGAVPSLARESSGFRVEDMAAQDRQTALRFWAFRVGRGLLISAGEGVNHSFVDRAFGGLGKPSTDVQREERMLAILGEIDTEEINTTVTGEGSDPAITDGTDFPDVGSQLTPHHTIPTEHTQEWLQQRYGAIVHDEGSDEAGVYQNGAMEVDMGSEDDEEDGNLEDYDGEIGDDVDDDDDEEEEEEEDEDEDEDAEEGAIRQLLYRSSFERSAIREKVKTSVPCVSHTRFYRGHCNVQTVKDVNFFGLNDEYVVSGSDSGHVFIWDKNTSELLSILEGDGETVNVIQGHPHEPMLAVSGIDHTIKIFSPDGHARRNARKGLGVAAADPTGWSSISHGGRAAFGLRRTRPKQPVTASAAASEGATADMASDDNDEEPPPEANGLSSKKRIREEYQITSRNEDDRQGGHRDALLSRAMIAQVAARIRATRGAAGGPGAGADHGLPTGLVDDDGMQLVVMGPGGPIVVNPDNCSIM